MGEKYIDEPAVKMLGEPHLDDAIRQILLEHDQPPPDTPDRIPDELYAELQAAMDADMEADYASGRMAELLSGRSSSG